MTEEDPSPKEDVPKEEEPCEECNMQIGTFMAISLCQTLKDAGEDAPDCKELQEKYTSGEMSPYDIIQVVKKYVKGNDADLLDEILVNMGVKDLAENGGDGDSAGGEEHDD